MNDLPDLDELAPSIRQLLTTSKLDEEFQVQSVPGGRNNRLYHLRAGSSEAALKCYYSGGTNTRNRLAAEFEFCSFCWRHGIHAVPRPLAMDPENQLGLYEWVAGTRAEAVTAQGVEAAVDFIVHLNQKRAAAGATDLPEAAEACFTFAQHLACVDQRVVRLASFQPQAPVEVEARRFVDSRLLPAWQHVEQACGREISNDEELTDRDRFISPSDFGFHNALVTVDREVRFLDFEYAGWDDPAKLVCDFFCQIERPVSLEFWDRFVASLAALTGGATEFSDRCLTLLPVYQVKWACIVLNEFLPQEARRREFSAGEPGTDERLREQLRKAEGIVETIEG